MKRLPDGWFQNAELPGAYCWECGAEALVVDLFNTRWDENGVIRKDMIYTSASGHGSRDRCTFCGVVQTMDGRLQSEALATILRERRRGVLMA